jgi:ribosome-associated toxin RatA of RatAB toxin-antitoxin module
MMRTVDHRVMRAPIEVVFAAASDVERWPGMLPHYRWVTLREPSNGGGIVEMAAWRPFGAVKYPTWWVSRMEIDRAAWQVRYRHIDGVTRGMDVVWQLVARNDTTEVTIVHQWTGPGWPLIGRLAANLVIGPVFIHGIASRTLAGIARHVERNHG